MRIDVGNTLFRVVYEHKRVFASMASRGGRMEQKNFSKMQRKKVFKNKAKKRELFLQEVQRLKKSYEEIDSSTAFETFEQLPLTSQTLKGLKESRYVHLTDIQRESIALALKGNDILGAAKTGSGKTLAFVIPVLECLFREGWSKIAGLGALIITPTRELAYQIFSVFKKVGKYHDFTVALVIGGKDQAVEKKILDKFNIVICTPGRLLQHMDENPLFDGVNLQILVLDEADRILDLGFAKTMDAIIENLPQDRQTMLFSATQTKSVKDLARLSLKEPKYVSVHEHAKYITPESLIQSYIVMEAQSKIDFLWSFLRRHKKQKILVFMASCKQVKYTFEVFCRLRPGISVTALYGTLHQLKRLEKYDIFCRKEHVVMFATDIAARGLDFPNVNWVLQLDCPEDVNTYIHRAGRTARYCRGGESLLILLPSEKDSMIKQMEARRIPITEIQVNSRELFSVSKKLTTICCNNKETLESAKRAFNAYLKSVFLMKDKAVFDVKKINAEAYARSLGLLVAPRTRFINRHLKMNTESQQALVVSKKDDKSLDSEADNKTALNTSASELKDENMESENSDSAFHLSEDSDGSEDFTQDKSKPQHVLEASISNNERNSEGDVLQDATKKKYENVGLDAVWNTTVNLDEDVVAMDEFNVYMIVQDTEQGKSKPITKFAAAKKMLKSNAKPNVKITFDEEGEAVGGLKIKAPITNVPSAEVPGRTVMPDGNSLSYGKIMSLFTEAYKDDKETYKKKVREKHREERIKLKELKRKRDFVEEDEPSEDESQDVSSRQRENNLKQYIEELPDPDKFFGKESESDENIEEALPKRLSDHEDEETVESMSETEQPKQKQKKTKKKKIGSSRKKQKLATELPSNVQSTLAMDADEEFALNLLQGS